MKRQHNWIPSRKQRYYYIDLLFENFVQESEWDNLDYELDLWDNGLVFKTREEAEVVANKIKEALEC